MITTPASIPANRGLCVASVPADGGVIFCFASDPASAPTKIIGRKRPKIMASPPRVLKKSVLPLRPAKAEPLLFAIEVKAYKTSVRPCGPLLRIELRALRVAIAMPVQISATAGVARMYSAAYFISAGRTFLPRYSGVRPTIRPATKTVTMARMSMPYRPEPVPPGAISPNMMSSSAMPPPIAVNESCAESTAPVEVSVVEAANRLEPGMPKRTSLPSIAPCASCSAAPQLRASNQVMIETEVAHRPAITATMA